jgi:hypothetical protein
MNRNNRMAATLYSVRNVSINSLHIEDDDVVGDDDDDKELRDVLVPGLNLSGL